MSFPNPVTATVSWLWDLPDITTEFPTLTISAVRRNVGSRKYGIVPAMVGGSASRDLPLNQPRIDLKFFGPDEHNVARLYEFVYPSIIPLDRRSYGFTAQGCKVTHIWHEGGPHELIDDDDGLTPMILLTVRYQMVAKVYA
jgi:hypothetical protein